jgi:adenosylhomocysteine nucleosidase
MSAGLAISDPCVVFALRRESMYFRRAFRLKQHFLGAPCRAHFRSSASQSVLMLETGLGAAAMATALRWCLKAPRFGDMPYRPRFVLSAGFSGALRPDLHVGDLIRATEVLDPQGNLWPTTWPMDGMAVDALSQGPLLTVSQLVSDPRQKRRLGRQYGALAVDMESAVVARFCHEQGIPFGCVRVISDDGNTTLSPHLVALLRAGGASPVRLASTLLRRPALTVELWRLAGKTRLAAKRLGDEVVRWLDR